MRSEQREQDAKPMKHFVVRCEWVGAEGQDWRFLLIDPQTAKKVYIKNLDSLKREFLAQLNQFVGEVAD